MDFFSSRRRGACPQNSFQQPARVRRTDPAAALCLRSRCSSQRAFRDACLLVCRLCGRGHKPWTSHPWV